MSLAEFAPRLPANHQQAKDIPNGLKGAAAVPLSGKGFSRFELGVWAFRGFTRACGFEC